MVQNWDPVLKDNIMVTGYMVLACGVYQSATGDDRYAKERSLDFQIDSRNRYKHDIHTMYQALLNNWRNHHMTLYPCEVGTISNLIINMPQQANDTSGSLIGSTVCVIFRASRALSFTTV